MLLISGTPQLLGDIDGRNTTFVAQADLGQDAIVSINGLSRAPGAVTSNGYVLTGRIVQLAEALVPGDILTVYLPPKTEPAPPLAVQAGGVRPEAGRALALRPAGSAAPVPGSVHGAAYALRPIIAAMPKGPAPGLSGTAERT